MPKLSMEEAYLHQYPYNRNKIVAWRSRKFQFSWVFFFRLKIEGQDYGVMPFIVHPRDLDTWISMSKVEAGSMGPKIGLYRKINGCFSYNNDRIPIESMPIKYVSVDKECCFGIEEGIGVLYSVIIGIRTRLIQHSGTVMLRALTIETRFLACKFD
jgi:hypothetical protein